MSANLLPHRLAGLIPPKQAGVYVIAGTEPEISVTVFWRGHVTETIVAVSYPEATRLSRKFADQGYLGIIAGTVI